ncbi:MULTISPECIES: 3D domain-containing protein [unclassified Nostoc]|uniref:3D domain-containing protein n=1 Tax=unclassified Nostoc TaxID=2593658 RepID=UPI002AD4C64A|nr:3D domain-containing protein [Nostoc sp. DedQUE03]MDZ7977201.1 3D domain-containing protein [Nostoc sp. DedQUE03]MDZ8042729.1 3D domain-containing protein [Nostoc sp. DedQUE02]
MSCQSGSSYIVESGDTLYTIAEEQLGDGDRSNEIKNPDGSAPNPDNLQPGQELCLPEESDLTSDRRRHLNLEATFYSREETQCHPPATGVHGVTLRQALAGEKTPPCGSGVGRLQCAVDPDVIPLHKKFTLILWNGKRVKAVALDTGTRIQGHIIDIFVDTTAEAINLGRKHVKAIL